MHFIGGAVCDQCSVPLMGADRPGHFAQCDTCMRTPMPWNRGRAAMMYKDQARKLVLALKHGDRHDIFKPAGTWLAQAAKPLDLPKQTLVVPVPLHWARLARRRYNQAAMLAQAFAREAHLNVCPDVLLRPQPTGSLDGRSRYQRFEVMADAISVHPRRRHRIIGRPIVILDDVMTSGATLSAATEACLAAGAGQVDVLVLARVDKAP